MVKIETIDKIKKFFIYFMLYSIIGWIYEVFLEVVVYKWGFTNRGVLFGPYCPVYGFGALAFLFINYENFKITKQKGENTDNSYLQIVASEISTLATIIVLYVVLKSAGEDYTIISGVENPSL